MPGNIFKKHVEREGARTQSIAEDGAAMEADDASVSVAAAHAARVTTDILRDALDDDSPPLLLIGLRRAWIFSGHGHTLGLHVPPVGETEDQDRTPHPEDERARELILSFLQELAGAAATSE